VERLKTTGISLTLSHSSADSGRYPSTCPVATLRPPRSTSRGVQAPAASTVSSAPTCVPSVSLTPTTLPSSSTSLAASPVANTTFRVFSTAARKNLTAPSAPAHPELQFAYPRTPSAPPPVLHTLATSSLVVSSSSAHPAPSSDWSADTVANEASTYAIPSASAVRTSPVSV